MAKSTYTDKLHHGEVRRSSRFLDRTTPEKQNLAAKKGVDGAKRILSNNYKKK